MGKRTLYGSWHAAIHFNETSADCLTPYTPQSNAMLITALLSIALKIDYALPRNQVLPRATAFEIPLRDGVEPNTTVDWGLLDRSADHATVAVNSAHDILVAYQTTRTDIDNIPMHPDFHEPLKQVEIAFFKYNSQSYEWTLTAQNLIGSVHHDPLNSSEQDDVRCERPDVIAVGNRFFVVWTRRYDRNMPTFEWEQAILECAWVEWTGTSLQVYNNGLDAGKGVMLDGNYKVRECAGVPDAVMLDPGSTLTDPTVGVVYPDQTDLGDIDEVTLQPPGDNTRLCTLRLIVTSLDSSNIIPNPGAYVPLVSNVKFDGDTGPQGQVSAGLILPDCARGQRDPVTLAHRFWLAYEEQFLPPSGSVPDGRIRLQLWEVNGGAWGTLVTQNLGSASMPFTRRRPSVSSCPEDAGGMERVSLTFGRTNTLNDDDVLHDEWEYDPNAGMFKVSMPYGHAFVNDSDDHFRPVILHGRNSPFVRRLFMGRNEATARILEFDIGAAVLSVKRESTVSLGRPAVGYRAGSGSVPDDIAITWEEKQAGVSYERIWIRVD